MSETTQAEKVKAFMLKMKTPKATRLPRLPHCAAADEILRRCSAFAQEIAESTKAIFDTVSQDQRLLRTHLIAEEFSELMDALACKDELEGLDALGDLLYVVIGTALQFDLPLDRGFDEIHASNMTKHTAKQAACNHDGDKGKGPDYIAPDLATILAERD